MKKSLFIKREFKSNSGLELTWKIDCDALTDEDIETIAFIIHKRLEFSFKKAIGIPRGGLRLAKALQKYSNPESRLVLLVGDVLTTGRSMNEWRERLGKRYAWIAGVVIFARAEPDEWITPVFTTFFKRTKKK